MLMVNSSKCQLDTAYGRCWTDLNQVIDLKTLNEVL